MDGNKWSFKIELTDKKVFDKYEKQFGIIIPQDMRQFIIENNAANPSLNLVMLDGIERVLDSVLSFNEKEDDAVTFAQIFRTLKNVNNIPFAMDPFGNVFCYNTIDNVVVFYNHEVNRFERTNMGFKKFISSLHA